MLYHVLHAYRLRHLIWQHISLPYLLRDVTTSVTIGIGSCCNPTCFYYWTSYRFNHVFLRGFSYQPRMSLLLIIDYFLGGFYSFTEYILIYYYLLFQVKDFILSIHLLNINDISNHWSSTYEFQSTHFTLSYYCQIFCRD